MIEIINTNADRIRSMNDEELAKFIESLLPNGLKITKRIRIYWNGYKK